MRKTRSFIQLKLIIEITRFLNSSIPQDASQLSGAASEGYIRLIIHIDKMSRLFIVENEKTHSFYFPFSISTSSSEFFISFGDYTITSATCSVLSAVFSEFVERQTIEQLLLSYWEIETDFEISRSEADDYGKLISHLLLFEPGYLRLDHDEDRSNTTMHPTDHIDFNYTNGSTFKIGLQKQWTYPQLINLVDIKAPCSFLSDKTE